MLKVLLIVYMLLLGQGKEVDNIDSLKHNVGEAINEHYVAFYDEETGYYIEQEGLIIKGDIVYINEAGDIFVINNKEE